MAGFVPFTFPTKFKFSISLQSQKSCFTFPAATIQFVL